MGLKLAAGMFLIVCGMGVAFKFYYDDSQQRIATLNQNNATLESAVSIQQQTLTSLQQDYARSRQELQRVNAEFARIRQQNNELAARLEKHDIGVLASARPGLVERTINRASQKAKRCFELLSGAELTEDEKNAATANQFNSECPWLWPNSPAD